MWHDPRRGLRESDLFSMFLCILPPAEFAKREHIFRDVNALVLLMKAESHVPMFDNLNRDSFERRWSRDSSSLSSRIMGTFL